MWVYRQAGTVHANIIAHTLYAYVYTAFNHVHVHIFDSLSVWEWENIDIAHLGSSWEPRELSYWKKNSLLFHWQSLTGRFDCSTSSFFLHSSLTPLFSLYVLCSCHDIYLFLSHFSLSVVSAFNQARERRISDYFWWKYADKKNNVEEEKTDLSFICLDLLILSCHFRAEWKAVQYWCYVANCIKGCPGVELDGADMRDTS